MKFIEMPKELQTKSIETLSLNYGMPEQIIEKDWWVTAVLYAVFHTSIAECCLFNELCVAIHKPFYEQ